MAITTTIAKQTVFGDMRAVMGTSVISGSASTANVVTGLTRVVAFIPTVMASSGTVTMTVDESFLLSATAVSDVSVKTSANDPTFTWLAIGF